MTVRGINREALRTSGKRESSQQRGHLSWDLLGEIAVKRSMGNERVPGRGTARANVLNWEWVLSDWSWGGLRGECGGWGRSRSIRAWTSECEIGISSCEPREPMGGCQPEIGVTWFRLWRNSGCLVQNGEWGAAGSWFVRNLRPS